MMYKMILLVVGVLGAVGLGSAQLVQVGQCGTINYMNNFALASFIGTNGVWYEISKTGNQVDDCSRLEFGTGTGTVTLSNPSVVNNFAQSATGTATHTTGTPTLTLTLTSANNPIEFNILNSDYNNYAIGMNCVNLGTTQRSINMWILGRTATALDTAATLTAVNNALSAVGVTVDQLTAVDHSTDACTIFPTIPAGQDVILPGQCATNIPVMQAFNVGDFEGTWYEISSYYSDNAVGTCAKADYTLVGSTVNVVNSQVLNGRLETITGTATLIGTNQEGRLNVVLNVNGVEVTRELLILDTNYGGYAVSYTCENLANNQRRVNSWILSRSQTITQDSQTEVTRVINSFLDLNTAYYQPTDQSPAGCFYYPIFQPGVPVIFPGQCDQNIQVQAAFDPEQYVRLWHDIESYPSTFQQGTCNNAFYTLTPEGTVDVFNTQVVNQRLDTMRGVAVIPDSTQPAKLVVSFPVAGTDQTTSTNYWVLATDYNTYSLVYTCENLPNNQRAVFSWKLGRTKAPFTNEANAAMNAVINTIDVLDSQYFANRDQSPNGCFYFPDPEPGRPVIFPGQCDNSVAAVPAFNLNQFIGTWHEIETYPKEQQTGTCVNHDFTAGTTAGTLNLVSNQVINQIANSASGSVAFESTDGSGRLRLTMTVNGLPISFPYWVLATDYNSYALIYSCMDRDDDTRAVYSWKLSNTQTLSAAANTAINNAINAVQVLDNQYYESVDQSAAACQAYPEIPAGNPIIIPGQCGAVTPVTSFQSSAFTGNWYEIARYGSERQTGDCAAKQFTSTGQTFTLSQTIIYNERLTTFSGLVTLPTDGSGILTAALTDGTISYTITIYVLDVIYNDFALLYSCENIPGSNTRQLYSWKLSRAQTGLSQTANDRIAQVIANTDGLVESYYRTTSQTSNACFYYPVFTETPEAIILPGTCPFISAKPNFEPARYLGTWYDVASYPIESQNGTCSRAEYTLVDGVITIRNTMVVDQTLRVQNGIARLSSDGTGLLTVTFVLDNGDEVVSTYYVLETDYTDFSLVYNCRNLQDGTRQVTSWKLSRTPTLTTEANTAIAAIISNTQGLLEEYYVQTSQSIDDCFYMPTPVPGQSVLFRRPCPTPTLIQQFNVAQYLGWWHELERYPSENDATQCSSSTFTQGATSIQVVESSVNDGELSEVSGNVSISTTGIMSITRDNVQSLYYVLDTDYTSYSVVYSCETVFSEWGPYSRVWSAKYGRVRSLTAEDNAAIDAAIAPNPVLLQDFYDPVNQSDAACFHYRDDASDQVILPGQCDDQIPVQAEFEVSRFAGTWYQIERYPYPQVSNEGTCVGTRYTPNNNGLTVLNWEVLDGTLRTIQGSATVDEATATLNVNLPQEGDAENRNAALRVLRTDYENYALLYSCVNINQFQRSVGAFKVSRDRSLSNDAQYAILNYTNYREEFHEPYFISITHNNQCLEPSSALLVKSSIIVILVCFALQLVM